MKLFTLAPSAPRRLRAFTFVEMMVTMITVVLVVGAALAAYIYGLRMTQFVNPKLGASDEARKAISLLTDEIRSARSIKIGNGTISSFTEAGPFVAQEGNSLQVYPSVNTNSYIRYFWDSADERLKRTTNGTLTYNGSMVVMFPSQIATGLWRGTGETIGIYNPSIRAWAFDQNFRDPNKIPPGTPSVRVLIRGAWAMVRPGTTDIVNPNELLP